MIVRPLNDRRQPKRTTQNTQKVDNLAPASLFATGGFSSFSFPLRSGLWNRDLTQAQSLWILLMPLANKQPPQEQHVL